jgi:hypothetical protein
MSKPKATKAMFSLAPVLFRNSAISGHSAISGRGVFARKAFAPGDVIVPYAPKQHRLPADSPEAEAAAESKLTLLAGEEVVVPDTSVPGGWLCNHSCKPNAALYASGAARIQCTRPIAPGEEVTIFYGWVSHEEPYRDPCRCGQEGCRGTINFDLSAEDATHVEIVDGRVVVDKVLEKRLREYEEFVRGIGQEQVLEAIATILVRMKTRPPGSVVCAH